MGPGIANTAEANTVEIKGGLAAQNDCARLITAKATQALNPEQKAAV